AHAASSWTDHLLMSERIPRWFNEGMARYMEPDGWTPDLDIPLRVAAVSGKLNLGDNEFLSGTLMYEAGQSLVRYIAAKYGDSTLVKIVKQLHRGLFNYFDRAVEHATKHSFQNIYDDWHKSLTVLYNTTYGQKEDIETIGRKIPT